MIFAGSAHSAVRQPNEPACAREDRREEVEPQRPPRAHSGLSADNQKGDSSRCRVKGLNHRGHSAGDAPATQIQPRRRDDAKPDAKKTDGRSPRVLVSFLRALRLLMWAKDRLPPKSKKDTKRKGRNSAGKRPADFHFLSHLLSHLHFFVPLVSLVGKKRIAHEEHEGHEEEGKEQVQEVTCRISTSFVVRSPCRRINAWRFVFPCAISGPILLASVLARRKIFASREEMDGLCHSAARRPTTNGQTALYCHLKKRRKKLEPQRPQRAHRGEERKARRF